MADRYLSSKVDGEQRLVTRGSRSISHSHMASLSAKEIHAAVKDTQRDYDKDSESKTQSSLYNQGFQRR